MLVESTVARYVEILEVPQAPARFQCAAAWAGDVGAGGTHLMFIQLASDVLLEQRIEVTPECEYGVHMSVYFEVHPFSVTQAAKMG